MPVPLKRRASLVTSCADAGELPLITLDVIEPGGGRLTTDEPPFGPMPSAGAALVRPGDVLYGKLRPYLAKSVLVSRQAYASTELLAVRPTQELDSRFLAYTVRSRPFVEWTVATSEGTKMPRTSWEKVRSYAVHDLPLDRQRSIADFLDSETARVDALIAKKRRMIDVLADARDRQLDHAALPGFAPQRRGHPADVPIEAEAPSDWSSVPIGKLVRRITYGFTNPMPTAEDGPYMLTANDVGDGEVLFHSARRTTGEAFTSLLTNKSRPTKNDVLLTKDGTLGRVAMCHGEEMCVNQSVAVLTPADTVDPQLLFQLLRVPAYRDALVFNAGGTTIKHLYITRVVKQRLALPRREQHARLAAELARIHESHSRRIRRLQRSIDLLQEHREALITAAVTGQLAGVAA